MEGSVVEAEAWRSMRQVPVVPQYHPWSVGAAHLGLSGDSCVTATSSTHADPEVVYLFLQQDKVLSLVLQKPKNDRLVMSWSTFQMREGKGDDPSCCSITQWIALFNQMPCGMLSPYAPWCKHSRPLPMRGSRSCQSYSRTARWPHRAVHYGPPEVKI